MSPEKNDGAHPDVKYEPAAQSDPPPVSSINTLSDHIRNCSLGLRKNICYS